MTDMVRTVKSSPLGLQIWWLCSPRGSWLSWDSKADFLSLIVNQMNATIHVPSYQLWMCSPRPSFSVVTCSSIVPDPQSAVYPQRRHFSLNSSGKWPFTPIQRHPLPANEQMYYCFEKIFYPWQSYECAKYLLTLVVLNSLNYTRF